MAHEIRVRVRDHQIEVAGVDGLVVRGSVNHWTLTAEFDEEWDNLAKRVTFSNCDEIVGPIDYADGMLIPWETLVGGSLRLSFVGIAHDGIETVRTAHMKRGITCEVRGADLGAAPREATKDIVAQAREQLDTLAEHVEDAGEVVEQARQAVSEAEAATANASSAADGARAAAAEAHGMANEARSAATSATNAAALATAAETAAHQAAGKADASAFHAQSVADAVQRKLDAGELVGPPGPPGAPGKDAVLVPATATTLGAVKVGANLAVSEDGTLSALGTDLGLTVVDGALNITWEV